eukprot:scaffold118918_cov27-Tisochrysis_lutea.AAC.2
MRKSEGEGWKRKKEAPMTTSRMAVKMYSFAEGCEMNCELRSPSHAQDGFPARRTLLLSFLYAACVPDT